MRAGMDEVQRRGRNEKVAGGTKRSKRTKQEDLVKATSSSITNNAATTTGKALPVTSATSPQSFWKVLWSNSFVHAVPFVLIAFLLKYCMENYNSMILQNPDQVQKIFPFLNLRPAVGLIEARQVLIVGTKSSGTTQVSMDLAKHFGFEIGHEVSNSQKYYVRDGTVSWFHGIRFIPIPKDKRDQIVVQACVESTGTLGFHPSLYRSSLCSKNKLWSKCWAHECRSILKREWACAWTGTCETPFAVVLHQVRNPIKTVESLVAKYCQDDGGQFALNGTLHPTFVKFNNLMFGQKHNFTEYDCIGGASHYVMEYTRAMISAREEGLISGMYKVEDTSLCDVAKLAGFRNETSVVYPPNFNSVETKCASQFDKAVHYAMKSNHNKVNQDTVFLDWNSDFKDQTLVEDLKSLMRTLGYDPDESRQRPKAPVPTQVSKEAY